MFDVPEPMLDAWTGVTRDVQAGPTVSTPKDTALSCSAARAGAGPHAWRSGSASCDCDASSRSRARTGRIAI